MDRKTFLKSASVAAAALSVGQLSSLVGCASAGVSINAILIADRVIVPLEHFPDLTQPNSYAKVYVREYPNPIIVFAASDARITAILSTCAHSGCEVRKLRNKFECPCHGSEYDLKGGVLKGPALDPLDTFTVRRFEDRLEFLPEGDSR